MVIPMSSQLFDPTRSTRLDGYDRTTTSVNARMSEEERRYIERIAKRYNVTLSEVVRQHVQAGMEADRAARKRSRKNGGRARPTVRKR